MIGISDVYVLLTGAADAKNLSPGLLGAKDYMLTENGDRLWTDFARDIGRKVT